MVPLTIGSYLDWKVVIKGWNNELSTTLLDNHKLQNSNPNLEDKCEPHGQVKMGKIGTIPQHVAKWRWVPKINEGNSKPGPSKSISVPTTRTSLAGGSREQEGFNLLDTFSPSLHFQC